MPLRLRLLAGVAALAAGVGLSLAAADIKIPPSPSRWVTDEAGFLSPNTAAALDAKLSEFNRETGHQVLVYIARTTGDATIEEWAVKAFEAWKVGRKGLDDGLVLFIMTDDRKVRIEVGYGLEDRVPDISAFRIINEVLVPGLRSGDKDAAVSDAVTRLLSLVSGREEGGPEPGGPASAQPKPGSVVETIFVVIAVIFFLILLITHPSLALWLLFTMFTGGRGGGRGGGFGGGGFSGGGGRSGGGGASGSW